MSTTYGIGLSNTASDEHRRLRGAEELFDPGTFRHLDTIGLGPGMRCLEVGAGGGSVARFMAERVGPTGSVLVTDIDLSRLEGCDRPNVHAVVHDITTDALPPRRFDVVHARLVLEHLPCRLLVLEKLVAGLRPGGWILVEDLDASGPVHLPPSRQLFVPDELGVRHQRLNAAAAALVADAGVDLEFGRELPAHLARLGLDGVDAEVSTRLVPGGSRRADFFEVSLRQLGPATIATGLVTEDDVAYVRTALATPGSMMPSFPMVSAWGRRKAGD